MAKKVQQTKTTNSEVKGSNRVRPQWRTTEDNIIELINADKMTTEQTKYLKAFVGKTSTSDRVEKLIAAIKANEGEIAKKPTPQKEKAEKMTKEQMKEATKSAKEEVAPTSEPKDKSKKADSKGKKAVDKPKAKPQSKKGSKVSDLYDSETVYEEGQIVDCTYAEGIKFKVLSPDAKPKLHQWAFVPGFKGVNEEGEDLFMRINYIGKNTVWMLEPFLSENMIPIGPEALSAHFMDEVDDEGNVIPEEEWIPFYLCEMFTETKKKEEPKEEAKAESKEEVKPEPEKKEEKPKAKVKVKSKNKKDKTKTTA